MTQARETKSAMRCYAKLSQAMLYRAQGGQILVVGPGKGTLSQEPLDDSSEIALCPT